VINELLNIWTCGLTPAEFYGFIVAFVGGGIGFMYWLSIKTFRRK
jgi:uncharacterized protein YgfB (UPF0149 family)